MVAQQIRDRTDPDLLPDRDTTLLFQLYALLALAKGSLVGPADVHNAWVVWMMQASPDHASVQSFDQLPAAIQAADVPFVIAIREVAENLR